MGLICLSTNRCWVLFEMPESPEGHLGAAPGGHRCPSSPVLCQPAPCLWYPETTQMARVCSRIELLHIGFVLRLWVPKFRCPAVGQRCRRGFCLWILRVVMYMLEYLTCQLGSVRCGTGLTGDSSASGGTDGSEVGYPTMTLGTSV